MTVRLGVAGVFVAVAQVACSSAPAQPARTSPSAEPVSHVSSDRAARVIEAGEWIDSARKRLNKDDGAGCLTDLDRAKALDERTEARAASVRATCEMAAGRCQAGKARAEAWYRENSRLSSELVSNAVEALSSMYCHEGDMTPRDHLLHALFHLQQGAHVTRMDAASCQQAYDTAERLSTVVMPKDDDDTRVKYIDRTLYHQGAACMARAGDCNAAWKLYADGFPQESLKSVKDEKVKQKILKSTFESMIQSCKGKVP